jgi:hypothetical protein
MPSSSRQKRRPPRKNKRKRSNDTEAFEFSTEVKEDYGVSKKRKLDCKAVALGIFLLTLMIVGASAASYLDMFLWYNVDPDHVRSLTRAVMKDWFCNDDVMTIDFYRQVLQDSGAIERIRTEFADKTDGIFWGCIGALDGWLVKIHCPSLRELHNPGKYFSRKGFHAINVQVIVDKKKRILWRYIGEKGSSHDSKVFNESGLGKYLLEYADSLHARGLYIIGDSAYSIRSYLLTPFDNAQPQSIEDNFNYFLSSNRIYVECAFGEIDRRWGIFWKPLEGALVNHQYTIDSALRLHNFIVNYREEMGEGGGDHQRSEREELDLLSDEYAANNPFASLGPIAEEMDELRKKGRPLTEEANQKAKGKSVRDRIRNDLSNRGLARPSNARVSTTDRHNREVETREQQILT